MPRINLLPWREEQRKERKLAFMVALGAATGAAAIATFGALLLFGSMISAQETRNSMLRSEIKVLDKQIEEINNLESAKQKFIARMEIIEKLQRSRPEIVHLFDEIVRTVPDGVYLTSVKQTDKHLKFDGVAQSSTRVSAFMRNIDGSEWLKNPDLERIETKTGQIGGASFTVYADQVSTVSDDDAAAAPNSRVARAGGSQ
jgi:type IV pilus assembly protein PilN